VSVGVGVGATTWTVALLEAEAVPIRPRMAQVTVAVSVTLSPPGAERGTTAWACSWLPWPARSTPTVQVCVPSPSPQEVNVGAAGAGACDDVTEIRADTSSSRLTGEMWIAKEIVCPGAEVPAACTLTHRFWHWAATARRAVACAGASASAAAVPAPGTLTAAHTAMKAELVRQPRRRELRRRRLHRLKRCAIIIGHATGRPEDRCS
jgi:hypothetical protein